MEGDATVNTETPPLGLEEADRRVLAMQTKLHRWAVAEPGRRFDDVFNLVYDPAFLLVAWQRVRTNKGKRTAGIDGWAPWRLPAEEVPAMLETLRGLLKSQKFQPRPVRAVQIPKANGKLRQLGIPVLVDRIVQASLKLVLEPIFEADFDPASYGFRPGRNAHDAIADIHRLASEPCNYHWVFEADIKACFDNIDHGYLMDTVAERIKDKKLRALLWRFLKAGIMSEGALEPSDTGTPQGGIKSPLLANVALDRLDQHFRDKWESYGSPSRRVYQRSRGMATMKLIRYADDFVVMVHGKRSDAEALFAEVTEVLAPIGLTLSEEKTQVVHIDDGFDFLGWHIQRRTKRGTGKKVVYTYPSTKAVASIVEKVKTRTQHFMHDTLDDLLISVNRAVRGWCAYFRWGASSTTLSWVGHYVFTRVYGWLRRRHPHLNHHQLVKRHMPGWHIQGPGGIELYRAEKVPVAYWRYRGNTIPNPWNAQTQPTV
jgi:RNA-directed DNA polymerase